MKIGILVSLAALAAAALAAATQPPQDAKPHYPETLSPTPPAQQAQEQTAMQDAMRQASAVNDQHRDFAKSIGTWQARYTCFMDPSHPQEGTGTSTFETILGGRYLVEHANGNMPPMGPFQGLGIMGFNNTTNEYEYVWLSDSGTAIMTAHGQRMPDGTVSMSGDFVDPVTKAKNNCQMQWRDLSENEKRFEMTCKQPSKEMRMEALYTRSPVGMR
jgi:hypothetical protein